MIVINYDMVVTDELLQGNIDNNEFEGFLFDYRVLHCLIRKYKLNRFLEIGCNMGIGTKIIKNAIEDGEVFSLDLPTELAHISLQGNAVGHRCGLPFTLLRGDSLKFDYSQLYPIDGWFIDGEHDYEHPNHEAKQAIKSGASLICFHDADIECVDRAIRDAFLGNEDYLVFRVFGTRICFAIKK